MLDHAGVDVTMLALAMLDHVGVLLSVLSLSSLSVEGRECGETNDEA